jgi:fluoride exporter
MYAYLIVFVGGGLGASLRHANNTLFSYLFGSDFPYSTLTINILGSVLMGVIIGWLAFRGDISQGWRLFLTTGVLGGFTTFSTFSLDVVLLWERGAVFAALAYATLSVVIAVAGLFAGLYLMRQIWA